MEILINFDFGRNFKGSQQIPPGSLKINYVFQFAGNKEKSYRAGIKNIFIFCFQILFHQYYCQYFLEVVGWVGVCTARHVISRKIKTSRYSNEIYQENLTTSFTNFSP